MLIPLDKIVADYNMQITGILHCGAHLAEEAPVYNALGIKNVHWIEANPALIGPLKKIVAPYGHRVYEAILSSKEGDKVQFNVANNGQSSSILPLGTHRVEHPEVEYIDSFSGKTVTIDLLVEEYGIEDVNFLNLDLQGAELLALQGAKQLLPNIRYVYTEVNEKRLYAGCALIGHLDNFLTKFLRLETEMTVHGWGDAVYVRTQS